MNLAIRCQHAITSVVEQDRRVSLTESSRHQLVASPSPWQHATELVKDVFGKTRGAA
jgi:hypothetical protein